MSSAVSYEALVARCAAGDDDALGALYEGFGRAAYSLARRITRDDTLAEDVVQEAFLDAWRGAGRFDAARGSVSTWVLTFVHRRAVDAVRRGAVRPRPLPAAAGELPEAAADDDVADTVADRESAATVRAALAQLPAPQRRVLELAYFEGFTQSEIAELLGEPLGTVKSRTHTALAKLRELIDGGRVSPDELPAETAALLSAHALGVLDAHEAAEAERLIASSEACRRAFHEALEAAAAIALTSAHTEPGAELRGRILEAARRLRHDDADR